MRLEHHLVGGYVRYISPYIIIIIIIKVTNQISNEEIIIYKTYLMSTWYMYQSSGAMIFVWRAFILEITV